MGFYIKVLKENSIFGIYFFNYNKKIFLLFNFNIYFVNMLLIYFRETIVFYRKVIIIIISVFFTRFSVSI